MTREEIEDYAQAQREVVDQQAKEIAELRQTCALRHQEIERLQHEIDFTFKCTIPDIERENKTLREALQEFVTRWELGVPLVGTYNRAQQALKEVS